MPDKSADKGATHTAAAAREPLDPPESPVDPSPAVLEEETEDIDARTARIEAKIEKIKRLRKEAAELEKKKKKLQEQEEPNKFLRAEGEALKKCMGTVVKATPSTCATPSTSMADVLIVDPDESTTPKPPKIQKKSTEFSDVFSVANVRVTDVPGWTAATVAGSGIVVTFSRSLKEKLARNDYFSYRDVFEAQNRSAQQSFRKALQSMFDDDESLYEDKDLEGFTLLDLAMIQTQFFMLYTQMYPQHALSHFDHQYSIFDMIKQGRSLKQVLDYDDYVRQHYIELGGEAWVSTDWSFLRHANLIYYSTNYDQEKQHKNATPSSFRPRRNSHQRNAFHNRSSRPTKPSMGNNPNKTCFAFNGLNPKFATCNKGSSCDYLHRCAHCKGPHSKQDCTRLKHA